MVAPMVPPKTISMEGMEMKTKGLPPMTIADMTRPKDRNIPIIVAKSIN
jgi:hypothetical protein